ELVHVEVGPRVPEENRLLRLLVREEELDRRARAVRQRVEELPLRPRRLFRKPPKGRAEIRKLRNVLVEIAGDHGAAGRAGRFAPALLREKLRTYAARLGGVESERTDVQDVVPGEHDALENRLTQGARGGLAVRDVQRLAHRLAPGAREIGRGRSAAVDRAPA